MDRENIFKRKMHETDHLFKSLKQLGQDSDIKVLLEMKLNIWNSPVKATVLPNIYFSIVNEIKAILTLMTL